MRASRNDRYKRQPPGTRAPRASVLIVCEGRTEEIYLKEMTRHLGLTAQVLVAPNTEGSAPISVVELAADKYWRDGPYEHVVCVFDRDAHESYDRAMQKIAGHAGSKRSPMPIRAITSVPCFELWLLLHFERSDAPWQSGNAVITRIREHLPGYRKASILICRELMKRLDTASDNAQWLAARKGNNNQNPSTGMHELVQLLQELT